MGKQLSAWRMKQPLVICFKREMTGVELIDLILLQML